MKISLRWECNAILIAVVSLSQKISGDLRFIQNLWALRIIDQTPVSNTLPKIIDRFSEEPYDTIVRILPQILTLLNSRFFEAESIDSIDLKLRQTIIDGLKELKLAKFNGEEIKKLT